MAILTLKEAYEQGWIRKGTQILMPVDSTRETFVPDFLSGVEGGYTVKYDGERFKGRTLDRCLCNIIGELKNGCIKAVGEVMPIYVKHCGATGLTLLRACKDYVVNSQLGYTKLGIAVEHITEGENEEYYEKKLLPNPKMAWTECYGLPSRYAFRLYNRRESNFGLKFMRSSCVKCSNLYNRCSNGLEFSIDHSHAVRPVYDLPIYSPFITILVDEKHDGKSEETAFIVQGPGMPEIA